MKNEEQPHAKVYSFQKAKRCGAKTRAGTPCKAPAVHGKNRCRLHGGANGSGAPVGNKNAYKHGYYSYDAIIERQMLAQLLKNFRKQLDVVDPAI